ncbi:hypothetical protein DLAC_08769 [Tieghemostelium lacteum]|uniref:Uncharacterized protein n=1 Tax=Tieghemostelium lacteum TaxID=361077 RepID=A0A151Z877_TIELA|nr:hypothetical protein DLAC_08769 [Tieghemostelium lacteum]|eukprot:KYQ90176.1 hypothetical protein DLAC_08769 [Tieghemostelium lacteum]
MRKSGTLSSVNMLAKMNSESDTPIYGSMAPYAIWKRTEQDQQAHHCPIIALKKTDPHVAHFKHFSKVSLVVYPLTPVGKVPSDYDLPRVNFSGHMKRLVDSELKEAEKIYLERHPNSEKIIKDKSLGFDFYQMQISDVYYYERDRKLSMIPLSQFLETKEDIVTVDSRELIETVNRRYQRALQKIAQEYGDVKISEDIFMYFVDSYGFNCIGKKLDRDEWLDIRIPFDKPFNSYQECKDALFETLGDILDKK